MGDQRGALIVCPTAREALARHRWHWTVDESNPERMPLREYARQVRRDEQPIRTMAHGYADWRSQGDCDVAITATLPDCVARAKMAADTETVAAAVAEAEGLTIGSANAEAEGLTIGSANAEAEGLTIGSAKRHSTGAWALADALVAEVPERPWGQAATAGNGSDVTTVSALADIAERLEADGIETPRGDAYSAESIAAVGLLHPLVVTPDGKLVAGRRRLAALHTLGREAAPVHVVENLTEAADLLRAEADENTQRKDLSPTEAWAIAKARKALLAPAARERQGSRSDLQPSGKLPRSEPRPREAAAEGTGYSEATLRKVDKVAEVAEDPETPEPVKAQAEAALAEMARHRQGRQALSRRHRHPRPAAGGGP